MSLVARSVTANRAGIDIGDEREESQNSLVGSVPVGTAEGRPGKGARMTPVGSPRSASSPDSAAGSTPGIAALAPSERALRPAFEVRCADVHPGGCGTALRAERSSDVVALACEHGALVHGLTPVWYSAERLAAIAAVVAGTRG